MALVRQIEDKGAVLEWSPVPQFPNLVALGTKVSSGICGAPEIHCLSRTHPEWALTIMEEKLSFIH
jgi:hypothetical protein